MIGGEYCWTFEVMEPVEASDCWVGVIADEAVTEGR